MPLDSTKPQSDDALYQQFLYGDTASYDQLMLRYGDSLVLFLYGYLHDWHEAEDQMIEAFARIMAKRPAIREGGFKAYLFRTARNLALRLHERKKRIQFFMVDALEPEMRDSVLSTANGPPSQDSSEKPLDKLARDERNQILQACMERIDPDLREALWLVYIEGMSYRQAAIVMGVREKRLDRLLTRGKQQMRTELEKEGITNAYE